MCGITACFNMFATNLKVLKEILLDAGYDADELLDKAQRQDIKDQLRANTDR
jgi:2-hydroxychromene-2-carboxylate isomerase